MSILVSLAAAEKQGRLGQLSNIRAVQDTGDMVPAS